MNTRELSPHPKKVFLHTQNHPQTQSSRAAPEMQAKNEEILFVVPKQNIPELWMSPCIIPVLCLLQYCFYLSHRRRLSITVCQLSLSVSFYLDPAANWSCRKKQSKCLFNTKKTVFHIKNKKNKMHTQWPEQTTVPGIVSAVDTWDIINHQGTQTP